jgi:hydrogenase maturation protein HypF
MKERRAIAVGGIVQGVGFRPFVHGLASRLLLCGFVRNHTGGVLIEVEGEGAALDRFLDALARQPPPLARIEHLSWEPLPPRGDGHFRIEASETRDSGPVFVSPDVATCEACLTEMSDPADRRHGYPFLNCTNCGPRLTIVRGAPYDRQRTTMAEFALCDACRAEYENPANRRFHAQPTACAACGPRLEFLDACGRPVLTNEPLADFARELCSGRIGALKGLGGYHLVCNASNATAVAELRRRKDREEKPFAIMVVDAATAEPLCQMNAVERDLLLSPRRPIVLLRKRPDGRIADEVAPRNPNLGIMLPYTPLHHLLIAAVDGIPLVMTSGNRSDEPIAYEDADAFQRLGGIADVFLIHNRPIHVRCDDSVTRVLAGQELPLRRSRGYAPQPVALPLECPEPILAVGGQFKGTFALGRGRHAFVSHHLGDLDHLDAYCAFIRDIELYEQLFGIQAQHLAHDLHGDYGSTRYARVRANDANATGGQQAVTLIPVQHHHAHMASCMAENGLIEPVIGVAFDGTGFGTDGAIWGGEFLTGDYTQFHRAAHFRYVGMPGGDRAIREPWRMALAHLTDAGCAEQLPSSIPAMAIRTVARMLEGGFNTPPTSSAGRLFDAAAVLAGIRDRVSFEGQAAMELEWLATGIEADVSYPFELNDDADELETPLVVDTRPVVRALAHDARRGVEPALIGRRFHSTVVEIIAEVCDRLRKATGLGTVVLSGGVFMNALLTEEVVTRLGGAGFRVCRHRVVPPNDGGLSLGQLAVAAARLHAVRGC